MLNISLSDNFELEGHIFIPGDSHYNSPTLDDDFSGTYTLIDDTVRFNDTGYFDYDPWMFIVEANQMETPDWTGWWAPIKIVLEKQ